MSVLIILQILPGILTVIFIWHLWVEHKKLVRNHPEMTDEMWIEFYKQRKT